MHDYTVVGDYALWMRGNTLEYMTRMAKPARPMNNWRLNIQIHYALATQFCTSRKCL